MSTDNTSLKKYISIFACFYTIMHLMLMGFMYFFDIEDGTSMNMPMLIISAFAVSKSFIKDNHRSFKKLEIRILSAACTAISFIASIFVYILVVLFDPNIPLEEIITLIKSLPVVVWTIIVLAIVLFYYFVLGIFYGWATNKIFSKQLNLQM